VRNSIDSLFHAAPVLLAALDESLVCRTLSASWRDLHGLDANAAIALPAAELLGIEPEAELIARLGAAVQGGARIDNEPIHLDSPRGSVEGRVSAWCARSSHDEHADLIVCVTDVGELLQGMTELAELQRHHQLILDSAGEGVYGLDIEGRVTFGNSATEQILGWRPADMLGQPAHDVHHHSYADGSPYPREKCPIYAALRDGEVHRIESEVFWHTNGSPVPVEYTSTPIVHNGAVAGAVVVFRDISERRKAEAERAGAYAEVQKLTEQLELERDYLRDEIKVTVNFGEIIGESPALNRTLAQIEAVAATPVAVLVLGEYGVGKEMVARAIHSKSDRAEGPLVRVDCASIPKDLFESEFFGHVKGAFTGAIRDRVGRFQLADEGTLFLDEIAEIPLDVQGKLLRVLQEGEFERVGEAKTRRTDVRIIAATNRTLKEEVEGGRFRQDLYYRLNVVKLTLPPLMDRQNDIMLIADQVLDKTCKKLNKNGLTFTQQTRDVMQQYRWPGNIRELENAIERAVILSEGKSITPELLAIESEELNYTTDEKDDSDADSNVSLEDYFQKFVLNNQDHMTETELAEKLGISRKSLWQKRQKLNIPRKKSRK